MCSFAIGFALRFANVNTILKTVVFLKSIVDKNAWNGYGVYLHALASMGNVAT